MWVLGARNTETQQFEGENTGHVENGYVWDLNTSIKTLGKRGVAHPLNLPL